MSTPPDYRPIRSFVLRSGRISTAQNRALHTHRLKLCVPYSAQVLCLSSLFSREHSSKILEIGFGMGEATAIMAQQYPQYDFLAIDVHTPGVGSLLNRIVQLGLENIRIMQYDAVAVIQTMLSEACLDGVHIFFPDPWPKKRHHKRRLIQLEFMQVLLQKLKTGGYVYIATDWQPYATWIEDVLHKLPHVDYQHNTPPIERPATKFETRGLHRGYTIWEFVIRKRA